MPGPFVRSSLPDGLISWVGWPSVRPSLNNSLSSYYVFSLLILISSLITWATDLKFRRMILDSGAHSRPVPDIRISSKEARHLKSWNRVTAYSSYPIELKLGTMILDITPHNRSEPDFLISFQKALWGRASCNLQIYSQPTVLVQLSWNVAGLY